MLRKLIHKLTTKYKPSGRTFFIRIAVFERIYDTTPFHDVSIHKCEFVDYLVTDFYETNYYLKKIMEDIRKNKILRSVEK